MLSTGYTPVYVDIPHVKEWSFTPKRSNTISPSESSVALIVTMRSWIHAPE
jgi:hypothetical protein